MHATKKLEEKKGFINITKDIQYLADLEFKGGQGDSDNFDELNALISQYLNDEKYTHLWGVIDKYMALGTPFSAYCAKEQIYVFCGPIEDDENTCIIENASIYFDSDSFNGKELIEGVTFNHCNLFNFEDVLTCNVQVNHCYIDNMYSCLIDDTTFNTVTIQSCSDVLFFADSIVKDLQIKKGECISFNKCTLDNLVITGQDLSFIDSTNEQNGYIRVQAGDAGLDENSVFVVGCDFKTLILEGGCFNQKTFKTDMNNIQDLQIRNKIQHKYTNDTYLNNYI